MSSQPPVPLEDLPRALWVVASTTNEPNQGLLGLEWPLAYRFGFAEPLNPAQHASLLHYLLASPEIELVRLHHLSRPHDVPALRMTVSVFETEADDAQQVFEVLLSNPRHHRQAIREIKQIVRPLRPYTALVVLSDNKLAGNTGLVWVVVRDELTDEARAELARHMGKLRGIFSVTARGTSTFELRTPHGFIKQPTRLNSPLIVMGVYPDFYAAVGATTYEAAVDQGSGM